MRFPGSRIFALGTLFVLLVAPATSLAGGGREVAAAYQGAVPRDAWDASVDCGVEPGVVCFDVDDATFLAMVDVQDATGLPQVYYVATRAAGEESWTISPSPFCEGSVHPVREGQLAIGVAAWAGWGCDGLPAAYVGTVGTVVVTFY